jgi:hypothetical protein
VLERITCFSMRSTLARQHALHCGELREDGRRIRQHRLKISGSAGLRNSPPEGGTPPPDFPPTQRLPHGLR